MTKLLILFSCLLLFIVANNYAMAMENNYNMVGIGVELDGTSYFGYYNFTDTSLIMKSTELKYMFEQGVGQYCQKNNKFYTLIQYVIGYTVFNKLLIYDVSNNTYTLSNNFPFIVYQIQGFGHTLTLDPSNCDVYITGRTFLPQYNNSHIIYKYGSNEKIEYFMALNDANTQGECMVMASTFDNKLNRIWLLMQLGTQENVYLNAVDIATKKIIMTVNDGSLGLMTLNYDYKSGNLYGIDFGISKYGMYSTFLIQINSQTGKVSNVKTYDCLDIYATIATINNKTHQLSCVMQSRDDNKYYYYVISLDEGDDYNVVGKYNNTVPFIISAIE